MIVLFPLFGLGVTHLAYSIVYTWTMFALLVSALGTTGLVWLLRRWKQ
jgi:hypothetical protein